MSKKKLKIFERETICLYTVFLCFIFFPTFFSSIRIYFLGYYPQTEGYDIASQLSWVSLFYECGKEAVILPLYYVLGKELDNKAKLVNNFFSVVVFVVLLYSLISLLIGLNLDFLMRRMAVRQELYAGTYEYIRLELCAFVFSVVADCCNIVCFLLKRLKELFGVLCVQAFVLLGCDVFLVSVFPCSAGLGVYGIPLGNCITYVLVIFCYTVIFYKFGFFDSVVFCFRFNPEWKRLSFYSGLESAVRNFAYVFVVLYLINLLNKQGEYWLAMNFLWGYLLVPMLALNETIKVFLSSQLSLLTTEDIFLLTKKFMGTVTVFVLIWILCIPGYPVFMKYVLNIENPESVTAVVLKFMFFYIVLAYNMALDSIFYAMGKIDLLLRQSFCINGIYYGLVFVCIKMRFVDITLDSIVCMFGLGIIFDALISCYIFYGLVRKKKLCICGK